MIWNPAKIRIFLTIFKTILIELYAEPYKGPNSMQNNHETHENSIKREYGLLEGGDVGAQMVNTNKEDPNALCYVRSAKEFHQNMHKRWVVVRVAVTRMSLLTVSLFFTLQPRHGSK